MKVVYVQSLSAHSMGSAVSGWSLHEDRCECRHVYSAVFNTYKQQDLVTLAGNMEKNKEIKNGILRNYI